MKRENRSKYFVPRFKCLGLCILINLGLSGIWLKSGFASGHENPIFGATHLLPSPFTLDQGQVVYGTSIAFGVTDFLQIGTNVLPYFVHPSLYNVNAKLNFIDAETFAFALTFGVQHYDYKKISASNPDLEVLTYQPGAVAGYAIDPALALFFGGHISYSDLALKSEGVVTSGYVHGTEFETDIAWAYNPPKKRRNMGTLGNILSMGVSYDATYSMIGYGVSHHWASFKFGVHYYPTASRNNFVPIIEGGGSYQF